MKQGEIYTLRSPERETTSKSTSAISRHTPIPYTFFKKAQRTETCIHNLFLFVCEKILSVVMSEMRGNFEEEQSATDSNSSQGFFEQSATYITAL
jgi:hypothetical protein